LLSPLINILHGCKIDFIETDFKILDRSYIDPDPEKLSVSGA